MATKKVRFSFLEKTGKDTLVVRRVPKRITKNSQRNDSMRTWHILRRISSDVTKAHQLAAYERARIHLEKEELSEEEIFQLFCTRPGIKIRSDSFNTGDEKMDKIIKSFVDSFIEKRSLKHKR